MAGLNILKIRKSVFPYRRKWNPMIYFLSDGKMNEWMTWKMIFQNEGVLVDPAMLLTVNLWITQIIWLSIFKLFELCLKKKKMAIFMLIAKWGYSPVKQCTLYWSHFFIFPKLVFCDEESVVLFDVIDVLGRKKNKKFASVSWVEHYMLSVCLFCVNSVIKIWCSILIVHNDESDISSGFSLICLSIFIGHVYIWRKCICRFTNRRSQLRIKEC